MSEDSKIAAAFVCGILVAFAVAIYSGTWLSDKLWECSKVEPSYVAGRPASCIEYRRKVEP